jgi:membrane protease YdiL (CAAX protease family)
MVQIVVSGVLFGLAHGLYGLSSGWHNGLDIMTHTALLGALYAIVYLLSRRSLMPCFVSHLLNDAIVLPWVFLLMFHAK